MADGGKRVSIKGRDSVYIPEADGHGHGHDKNRRRKSVASHMAHPITGETMKERQVFTPSHKLLKEMHEGNEIVRNYKS